MTLDLFKVTKSTHPSSPDFRDYAALQAEFLNILLERIQLCKSAFEKDMAINSFIQPTYLIFTSLWHTIKITYISLVFLND